MTENAAKKKSSKETTAKDGAPAQENAAPVLEQLVLDRKIGKYGLVAVISAWSKELRKMEEHRHLTQMEVLELAMTEVLSGKVSEKDVAKHMAAAAAEAPAGDEKGKKKS